MKLIILITVLLALIQFVWTREGGPRDLSVGEGKKISFFYFLYLLWFKLNDTLFFEWKGPRRGRRFGEGEGEGEGNRNFFSYTNKVSSK